MKYYCPCCKLEMKPIYCDCETVSSYRLFVQADGRLLHECGKPLSPEHEKLWRERDKNND